MILEAFLYATARTSPELRRLGLVGDAVALWSRATRRRRAWASHERRCREFVTDAVAGLASRRTVLVLGSGLIRDVPLDVLVASFERVVLLDAVHLLPARWRARSGRCELIVADLTTPGALDRYHSDPTIDLVVSANVLSQLPMAQRRQAGPGQPAGFADEIVARHLADLGAFRASVCLLTDAAYRDVDAKGASSPETALVPEERLPSPDATWDWEVAPRGEISRRFARVHRVRASLDTGRRTSIGTASGGGAKGSG